jgi:hypothetical protein
MHEACHSVYSPQSLRLGIARIDRQNASPTDKSLLLLFFRKEDSFFPLRGGLSRSAEGFFLERKKQRTFTYLERLSKPGMASQMAFVFEHRSGAAVWGP